jgi:hypothetical protein
VSAVLALFPELTDVNGDAQNALVLATRAGWAGRDASVERLRAGERPAGTPLAVVLGSTTDPSLPALLQALGGIREALADWIAAGIPLLAVGTGLEALTRGIVLPTGRLDGLGIVAGQAQPLAARAAGDLVVHSDGRDLVGYENHTRGLRLDAEVPALGYVTRGVGDGHGSDGVRLGPITGTHLHGPVLAKNPALADAVLAAAYGEPVSPTGDRAAAVDAAAARIRSALLASA